MNLVFVCVILYVLAQLAFGLWLSRFITTEDDYLLAGRRMGPLLTVFSIFATWFGAETCVGATSQAFEGGLSATIAEPFGYALCIVGMAVFFAGALWRRKYTTLADLFRERFGPAAERLTVLLIVPGSLLWAAAQIRAFGQVLSGSSGLAVEVAILLAALVVIVYTGAGGLLADAWSDLIQGFILLFGLIALFVAVLSAEGSPSLADIPAEQWSLRGEEHSWLTFAEAWALPVLGSLLSQELVARVLAARSPAVARGATLGGAALYTLAGLIPLTLGLLAAQMGLEVEESEQVLFALAEAYLPTVLVILFTGALVSAILSTVDTTLLVCGSLVAHNLVLQLGGARVTEGRKVQINRIAVALAGVFATVLAFSSEGVYALVEEASGLGSAGVLVAACFGLGTRFGGRQACLATLIVGLESYVAFNHFIEDFPAPYLGSLALSLLTYVGVALYEAPDEARLAAFAAAGEE